MDHPDPGRPDSVVQLQAYVDAVQGSGQAEAHGRTGGLADPVALHGEHAVGPAAFQLLQAMIYGISSIMRAVRSRTLLPIYEKASSRFFNDEMNCLSK